MTNLYKHETIFNRPVLRITQEKPEPAVESHLTQNPLLKKLRPSKSPSSIARFIRRFFANLSKFFKVQHPDVIQENKTHLIRPLESTPLTVGNLWHYYAHFLKEDKECPKKLKSCFEGVERDEMKLASLQNKKSRNEIEQNLVELELQHFAEKKLKKITNLKEGNSLLFLLSSSGNEWGDHSLSGDLFSVITKTQAGYTITFLGNGDAMAKFSEPLPSAGKEKIARQISFEIEDPSAFEPLISSWVRPEKTPLQNVIEMTEGWHRKEPTSLDDYMSKENRPDKLFWNILGAIPGKQGEVTRASVRSIRLRTELLTLYESFDELRVFSDGNARELRDFKKLLATTSAKVLLHYEKGYLSKSDLEQIVKRLTIIETTVREMERNSPSIPKTLSFTPLSLVGTPLKKAGIQHPQLSVANPENPKTREVSAPPPLHINLNVPISLETPPIVTLNESKVELEKVHGKVDEFRQGLLENNEAFVNQILTFFIRLDIQKLRDEHHTIIMSDDPLLNGQYQKPEFTDLLLKVIDLTEVIEQMRSVRTISQYDYEGLIAGTDFILLLSWMRSRYLVSSCRLNHYLSYPRSIASGQLYSKLGHEYLSHDLSGYPGLSIAGDDPLRAVFFSKQQLAPEEAYDLVFSHRRILMKLFEDGGIGWLDPTEIEKKLDWNRWLRPLENPYLRGLYRKGDMSGYLPKEEASSLPEAYFDNPIGQFDSYREKNGKNFSYPGSEHDMRMLSRLLVYDSYTAPEAAEFSAFALEQPHLMRNPDIRNFFDRLCKRNFKCDMIQILEKTKKEFETQLDENLITNPALVKEHFDLLLYYHERQARLKNPSTDEIRDLLALSRETPALNASYGYAVRVLLHSLLESAQEIKEDQFGEILTLYADAKTAHVDKFNVDPLFERKLDRIWMQIQEALKTQSPEELEMLTPLFERICRNAGIPSNNSKWNHQGRLVFANDEHVIDLKTWEISSPGLPAYIGDLPHRVRQNSLVASFLKKEDFSSLKVTIEPQEACILYSFQDCHGIATRIESRDNSYFLYREITIEGIPTWLQATDFTEKPEEKDAFAEAFSFQFDQKESKKIPFFENGLYVNPDKPREGYLLDSSGTKVAFKLSLRKTGKSLEIKKWTDLRKPLATGPWDLCKASDIEEKGLEFLKKFENSDSILLWSKKGSLKKVELVRYGITFALKGGKLIAETEPFAGYIVNPEGDTQGFTHALKLEHPDPSKGKKLLFPGAKAIKNNIEIIQPEAQGFAKIGLLFEKLAMIRKAMKGIFPSIVTRSVASFDRAPESLNFMVVDLRLHTNEICQSKNEWPETLIELMKHALISEKPELALSFFKKFPFKKGLKDSHLFNQLMQFTSLSCTQSPGESAIKVKMAEKLYIKLKANRLLKNEFKALLRNNIIENGKMLLKVGRSVPPSLQLSSSEMHRLSSVVKKSDPEFYNKHLALHLAEDLDDWKEAHQVPKMESRITALEIKIKPEEKLSLEELSSAIPKLSSAEYLLFKPEKVAKLFKEPELQPLPSIDLIHSEGELPCEREALNSFQQDLDQYQVQESTRLHYTLKPEKRRIQRFIDNKLVPLQDKQELKMAKCEKRILKLISQGTDVETKAAHLSEQKSFATLAELRLAFVCDKLNTLQEIGKISPACDLQELKEELTSYFDALLRKNAAGQAIQVLERMMADKSKNTQNWQIASDELHRLLTLERRYDLSLSPLMLVFEAQLAKNFRELPGGLNQLDLLEALLKDPNNLILAPTGAGKTAVLSVLEALLKPNRKNLVVQKVLPALYQQTYDQVNEVIGDLFNIGVMALRFNLQMPLTTLEYYRENNEEKSRPSSIFKGMYEELLQVIENKGCVLTDYSSLPMMEAKFLQLGHQMKLTIESDAEITPIQQEHHHYLRKILILLRNKGQIGMDEYDQPNRPTQKLQLDMQLGSKEIPEFFIDTSLEIFDLLAQDPDLKLKENLQLESSDAVRTTAIQNAAREMAKRLAPDLEDLLYQYIIGQSEEVLALLNESDELLDKIAFCKEQFSIYLPLVLNEKGGSKYKRSEDGSKTLPCFKGTPNPKAKQGTVYEQINYTIADYLQNGVTFYDIEQWMHEFKPEWEKASSAEKMRLQQEIDQIFPISFSEIENKLKVQDVSLLNQNTVSFFLKRRLSKIKSSGFLITIDPVNAIDMSLANSGISATSGAQASMHPSLKISETAGAVRAGMAYRIQGRAKTEQVIPYDPANPSELFSKTTQLHAVIDAAGAFNQSIEQGAENLKKANSNLDQVCYHLEDGTLAFLGTPSESLERTGIFFKESNTRGTDLALHSTAHALLTVNGKEGFRGLAQAEGRLRQAGQTYELAMPEAHAKENIIEMLSSAICQDGKADAPNIYRCQSRLIPADLRNQVMVRLLAQESAEEYVALLQNDDYSSVVITDPEKTYDQSGAFFKEKQHIAPSDTKPEEALKNLHQRYQTQAERLQMALKPLVLTEDILAQIPEGISAHTENVDCDLEAELEQDVQAELELELQMEQEVEVEHEIEVNQAQSKAGLFYPPWAGNVMHHSVHDKIHPAYDERLQVTEAFIPFKRNKTNRQFLRLPFERSMFNIGVIRYEPASEEVIIIDPVNAKHHNPSFAEYDIRLNRFFEPVPNPVSPDFYKMLVQVKFLDGRTSGYSDDEIAALEDWISANDPSEMKRHMLQDILRFRFREKAAFENSQLGELFRKLIP